jgi:hypothetical protein
MSYKDYKVWIHWIMDVYNMPLNEACVTFKLFN